MAKADGPPPVITRLLSSPIESRHQLTDEPEAYDTANVTLGRRSALATPEGDGSATVHRSIDAEEDSSSSSGSEDEYGPTYRHLLKEQSRRQRLLSRSQTYESTSQVRYRNRGSKSSKHNLTSALGSFCPDRYFLGMLPSQKPVYPRSSVFMLNVYSGGVTHLQESDNGLSSPPYKKRCSNVLWHTASPVSSL